MIAFLLQGGGGHYSGSPGGGGMRTHGSESSGTNARAVVRTEEEEEELKVPRRFSSGPFLKSSIDYHHRPYNNCKYLVRSTPWNAAISVLVFAKLA